MSMSFGKPQKEEKTIPWNTNSLKRYKKWKDLGLQNQRNPFMVNFRIVRRWILSKSKEVKVVSRTIPFSLFLARLRLQNRLQTKLTIFSLGVCMKAALTNYSKLLWRRMAEKVVFEPGFPQINRFGR